MTADEIRALPPGEAMDELVCTRFLGLHANAAHLLHPSTNMRDALRVWEELERRGHVVTIAPASPMVVSAAHICRVALESLIPKESA